MIRPIMKDVLFLGQASETAVQADVPVARDLMDTLTAHQHECVGMAANMIGVKKRIIIVSLGIGQMVMFNPVIVSQKGAYETEEGCLSLMGKRKTQRYQEIDVQYQDMGWKTQKHHFTGYTAQIIQHEIDHCNGIII